MGFNFIMKIAIVMTGHAKGWQRTYEGLQTCILGQHDVDIYISTWDVDNAGRSGGADDYPAFNTTPMMDLYKPKKFCVENHTKYHENRFPTLSFEEREHDVFKVDAHAKTHGSYWVERMRDMWYIIKKGFQLIENPQEYDIIMRLRFDIVFDEITFQKIEVPVFIGVSEALMHVHDLFGYGPPDKMAVYFHLFDYIETMYRKDNVNIAHSDEMLGTYLMKYNNIIPISDPGIRYHGSVRN